jgi:hypothetical protein
VHRLNHVASLEGSFSFRTSFRFEIPTDSDPQYDLLQADPCRLPPSLQASKSPYDSSDNRTRAAVHVSYELKAFVYSENILVSMGFQPIQLFPIVSLIPPPIALDDLHGEYIMKRSRILRKLFSKNKTLEISLTEPKPLVLRVDGQSNLHTVPIACRINNLTEGAPLLCAKITWRLKSSTIVSTIPLQSIPTSRQIVLCPFLAEVISRSSAKAADVRLTERVACLDTTDETDWREVNVLWLTIIQPSDAVPSFFSPYVSRRYSLELSIRIKGYARTRFDFGIPIQFVWTGAPESSSMDNLTSDSTDSVHADEQCPLYAR